jgi:hypothetical protein
MYATRLTRLCWILALVAAFGAAHDADAQPDQEERPDESFSTTRLQTHVAYLASDLFEGRAPGTRGAQLAAKYIAGELSDLGVEPAADDGSFYQRVPMHAGKPLPSSALVVHNDAGDTTLALGEDYVLLRTGVETFVPEPKPLVFAGYGIAAPEFDYNDYQSIDVADKIVVLLEGDPPSDNPNYFNGANPSLYANPDAKRRLAMARGAAGTVFVPLPDEIESWDRVRDDFAFERVRLAYSAASHLSLALNPDAADLFFVGTGISLGDLAKMKRENRVRSFPLAASLSFAGEFLRRDFVDANVVGLLPGSDPDFADEYVLVSAHYDHLGVGPAVEGDSIYNGALDNAIGVAGVLELARALKRDAPRRSILFVLTAGEEKGLLGATFYVDHPIRPLYKTVANVNVDGLATFGEPVNFVGLGGEYSTLGETLRRVASRLGKRVVETPPLFERNDAFARSDQIAFASAGVPAIITIDAPPFKGETRRESLEKIDRYMGEIYHTPFDDLDQPIDYDAAVVHLELVRSLILEIANADEAPEWREGAPFVHARLLSRAEGE